MRWRIIVETQERSGRIARTAGAKAVRVCTHCTLHKIFFF
jgi:hypothetical protein